MATSNLEQEYTERERREAKFEEAYPNGLSSLNEEITQLIRHGLYCGRCDHGNGCEHGVPRSRIDAGAHV